MTADGIDVPTWTADTVTLAALEDDPFPVLSQLRALDPVAWVPPLRCWLVTRWTDVQRIAVDPATFSSDMDDAPLARAIGPNMLDAQGDAHTTPRAMMAPLFSAGGARRVVDDLLPAIVNDLLDAMRARGEADLVADFTEPLAVRLLRALLGLEHVPEMSLRRWFNTITAAAGDLAGIPAVQAAGAAACAEFDETVLMAHANGACPRQSIVPLLTDGDHPRRLTRTEILACLKLLLIGGMQEPRDTIGLTTYALLTHPAALRSVQAEGRWRRAVEETLRWRAPVGTIHRRTRAEVTLQDTVISAGELVAGVLSSANRDEFRFADPDRFDIDRREGAHLAFGAGAHLCLGAWLARYETVYAVRTLFSELPDLRLDADRPTRIRGFEFHGPTVMPVRWTS